ncbi:MAG: DUF5752 family protein [Candidatus Acidiferrales bacterium]
MSEAISSPANAAANAAGTNGSNGTERQPFQFFTVASLTRIGNQVARDLNDLTAGLQQCSDASIFHHCFQTLGTHHFLTEGFSNDFAQWVLSATNREELAEQMAALDVRDYVSIAELRADLVRYVTDYCKAYPQIAQQPALEAFYFCENVDVTFPLGVTARTLEEFSKGLEKLSHSSFYFHFIASRLRLGLRTNDFSLWLRGTLGLEKLAYHVDRIDIYTNTIDSARAILLRLIEREMRQS